MKEAPASIMPTVNIGKPSEAAGLLGTCVAVSGEAAGLFGASVAVSGDAVRLFGATVALSFLGVMVGPSVGFKYVVGFKYAQQVSPTSPRSEAQTWAGILLY